MILIYEFCQDVSRWWSCTPWTWSRPGSSCRTRVWLGRSTPGSGTVPGRCMPRWQHNISSLECLNVKLSAIDWGFSLLKFQPIGDSFTFRHLQKTSLNTFLLEQWARPSSRLVYLWYCLCSRKDSFHSGRVCFPRFLWRHQREHGNSLHLNNFKKFFCLDQTNLVPL